jgi:hypothetical protein
MAFLCDPMATLRRRRSFQTFAAALTASQCEQTPTVSPLRPRPLAFESLETATTHLKLSRRACRHLRSSGCRCREGGVSDRHNRALWPGHSFNPGFEFLRERLDYARTEPSFWLGKDAVRLTNSIVGN